MRKNILILLSFLFPAICFSQAFCPDSLAIYGTFSTYTVDSFPAKTPVEIHLTSITLGTKKIRLDFNYKEVIEFETQIVSINDSIGVKLLIAPYQRYGKKFYMHNLLFYRKENRCWVEMGSSDIMGVVIAQTSKLNYSSVGDSASPYYLRVNEGWLKLN